MNQETPQIAHDILSYARANPNAADTVEGIVKWWLRDRHSLAGVARALIELVEEGAMVKLVSNNSEPIYKLNKRG